MEKITVWETFFMLLTVIPVSKMLSSIFMKLVARVGTVDEERWGMIGLGAIGATFGLMKKGGMAAGLSGMAGKGSSTGKTPGPPPSQFTGGNSTSGTQGMGNINAGSISNNKANISEADSERPGTQSFTLAGRPSGSTTAVGSNNVLEKSNQIETGGKMNINGYQSNDLGTESQVKGRRNINDIINASDHAGNKAAGVMSKVGAASSFPVTEAAPVIAGMYGVTGKAVGGFTGASYNLGKEIKDRKQNGQNFWEAMQDITGASSRIAATTQAATTLAMSPLGSRAASAGTQAMGRVVNAKNQN